MTSSPVRRRALAGIAVALLLMLLRTNARLLVARPELDPPLHVVALVHLFWALAAPAMLAAFARALDAPYSRSRRIATCTLIGASVLLLEPLWTHVVAGVFLETSPLSEMVLVRMDANVLVVALLFATELAAAQGLRAQRRLAESTRLQHALADAHLHALTIHLQPHFLFNTLQLVAETARTDATRAAAVARDLRRLVAEAAAHTARRVVPARAELEFLTAYLSIQQTRFEDRLAVDVRVDARARDAEVPHMLLQPLVENAIQHGVAKRAAGGHITIAIDVVGSGEASRLVATVDDDGPGIVPARGRSGRGLANTQARLQALYGDDFTLTVAPRADGGTCARVEMPLRTVRATITDRDAHAGDVAPDPIAQRTIVALIAGAWFVVWLVQPLFLLALQGGGAELMKLGAARVVGTRLPEAPIWIAAFLLANIIERRHPARWSARAVLAAHVVAALALAVLRELADLQYSSPDGALTLLRATMTVYGLRVVGAYAATVTLLRANALAHWAASHSATVRELREHVRIRQRDAERAKVHQPVVLACLDALEQSCRESPASVERCVRALSTALRLLLDALDDDAHSVARDLAILEAVAEVFGARVDAQVSERDARDIRVAPGLLARRAMALTHGGTFSVVHVTSVREPDRLVIAADQCNTSIDFSDPALSCAS